MQLKGQDLFRQENDFGTMEVVAPSTRERETLGIDSFPLKHYLLCTQHTGSKGTLTLHPIVWIARVPWGSERHKWLCLHVGHEGLSANIHVSKVRVEIRTPRMHGGSVVVRRHGEPSP